MPERERGALAEELRNTIFESGEEVNELLKSKVVSSAFAAVILHDKSEVLVVKEDGKPCEGLPGGGIDPYDGSLESGAARELFEETPFFVHPESLKLVCAFFTPDKYDEEKVHMKVFFSCPTSKILAVSNKNCNSQGVPHLPRRSVEILLRGREIHLIPPRTGRVKTEVISSHFLALAIWARKSFQRFTSGRDKR